MRNLNVKYINSKIIIQKSSRKKTGYQTSIEKVDYLIVLK